MVKGKPLPAKLYKACATSAARGAKLLDKERPGWFNKVKTSKLKMNNICACVYGQLRAESVFEALAKENDYFDAAGKYGYTYPSVVASWVAEGGFFDRQEIAWAAMEEEWLRQIRERRLAYREKRAANKA